MKCGSILLVALTCIAAAGLQLEGLFSGDRNLPPIEYAFRAPNDLVSALNVQLQAGKLHLKFEGPSGYLRAVLGALKIPVESQMLVFSKTSLQRAIITPSNPRSVFFNDGVAVGWVRGEPFVELAAEDPQLGVIFYTLDQNPASQPFFLRRDDCLGCHESYSSLGVPGTLVRSVFPAANGTPIRALGDFFSDHRSPFQERWGGWYVTGNSGTARHLGNQIFTGDAEPSAKSSNLASLNGTFDTADYLSPYSDIVALMIFEHQMRMVNLFSRGAWEVRWAASAKPVDLPAVLRGAAAEIADYLLFVDETPLGSPIHGSSGFAEKFAALAPGDNKGRSLRQFDLEHRLMRYPCSYMIYSPAFDALPAVLKDAIYRRMWQILSGKEPADRRAIVEILHETKPGLPEYFR